jgi:hypothetical protein
MPTGGRKFKLPGIRQWVGEIKQVTAREAAKEIVRDLVLIGPWYSGQFAKNWVVKIGDTRIPAVVPQGDRRRTPRVEIPLPVVPSLRGTGNNTLGYTIGNRTEYRNLALDLVPGRTVSKIDSSSPPKDWYRTYVEGGNLALTLRQATGVAAKDPKIRGFKGK